jgi:hypothetical protein
MDIQNQIAAAQTIYAKELISHIYPKGDWISKSRNDSKYVNGAMVQRSINSSKPKVRRNKTSLKVDPVRKTYGKKSYPIHEFSTDPDAIVFTEKMLTQPDLRVEAMKDHKEVLIIESRMYLKSVWAATNADRIIRTSGVSRSAKATDATGTRNAPTYDDLLNQFDQANQDRMPMKGRQLLIPVTWVPVFLKMDEFTRYDFISDRNGMPVKTGVIGDILGAEVWVDMDDYQLEYNNASTPVPQMLSPLDDGSVNGVEYVGAASNNLAAILWHPDMVTHAKGKAEVFIDLKSAIYQSDILSTNVIAGGDKYRDDHIGVVSLVEGLIAV